MDQSDVAIIGAGPIGLELAVTLKRAGVDYVHFDARQIGYTISWFAPQTRFFSSNERISIAGVPLETPDQTKATREQYLAYLRSIVEQFDLKVRTYEPVVEIEHREGGFDLSTQSSAGRRQCRVKRVVLATGGTARPRRLGIPGEDLPHVSHYFQDPHTYFRRQLLIVGGKNSAVEAALRCYAAGAMVTMSYRGAEFDASSIKYWLLPEINSLIERGAIAAYFQTRPVAITEQRVILADEKGVNTEVPADFVLLLVGYQADMSLARAAGVTLSDPEQRPTFDERTMETNVPGLYIAGTAVGGTQEKYQVFIENCHVHVVRIVAALTGQGAPLDEHHFGQAES